MVRRRVLATAVVLAVGCAPASAPSLTDAQRAAIGDSVRQLAAGLAARVSARGSGAFPDVMDSAPGYLWAYNGFVPFPTFDSMARWARADAAPRAPHVFAWDSVRVEALAPGIATFAAGYTEAGTDSAGRPTTEKGVFTGVAVHREAGWKFTNAHTSTLPPPPLPTRARR